MHLLTFILHASLQWPIRYLYFLLLALEPLCCAYTHSVGFLVRGNSLSQGRCLHRTTQTQNKNFTLVIIMARKLSPFLIIIGCTPLLLGLYTFSRIPWAGDQSVLRPLSTHRATQTQYKFHTPDCNGPIFIVIYYYYYYCWLYIPFVGPVQIQ
jgi:hypothetical protein